MKESPEGVSPLCAEVTPGSISPEASSRWLGYGEAIMNARNNTYGEYSPVLRTTITLERLKKRGYESMLDIYKKISPQLNPDSSEPDTSPAWFMLSLQSIWWFERRIPSVNYRRNRLPYLLSKLL